MGDETVATPNWRMEAEATRIDRDRWRAAFDRIALDPAEYRHALGHVVDCEDNCDQCQRLAQQALDGGVDAQERAADILAERDRLASILQNTTSDWMLRAREAERERDRLQAVVDGYEDEMSHIAFAVAGDKTGAVHHDDILDLAKGVVVERDRLRVVVEAAIGTIERAQFTGQTCDTCTETYRALGDESIAREPETLPFDVAEYKRCADEVAAFWKEQADERGAERDRLRAGIMSAEVHGELIVRMRESVWQEFEAERDRLRVVAVAAGDLLDDDRTSWSDEHAALAKALAALDGSEEPT